MHRPTPRRDALRERVVAGRQWRSAQRRRAAAARRGGRRMVALFAGLAMVASVITATQLASNALEGREGGLGAGECLDSQLELDDQAAEADPAEENQAAEEAEQASDSGEAPEQIDAAEDLEAHEEDGHLHYRQPGSGEDPPEETPDPGASDPPATAGPSSPPAEECEDEGDGGSGGEDPGDGGEDPGDGGEDPGDGGEDPGDGSEDPGDGSEDPGDGGDGDPGDPGDGGDGDPGDGGPGTVPPGGENGDNNGLEILGRDCSVSDLPLHTGFQSPDQQCVNTQAGEVSALDNNPSLLITDFPPWVETDEPFTMTVSTRNLVRDRFLGAGDGGYYLEASYLTPEGIQRGHFHTACTNLGDGRVAPDPATLIEPQFFAAVEDGGGGAGADFVTIEIPGLSDPGLYRCMSWAGDPSHRVPMMSFAREQIAADAVRIMVTEPGESGGPGDGEGGQQ